MIKTLVNKFRDADEAFNYLYQCIENYGEDFAGTKAMFNIGFQIDNPTNNIIRAPWRNWKHDYAKAEWRWYESGDRSVKKLGELYGKVPAIWERMADVRGNVNSNYGWQWERLDQLDKVVAMLRRDPNTRQAAISIYDGKEMYMYETDTPCTYAVQFTVVNNKLNMCVTMRSNDLWFGFCNDQYCFSELQKLVSEETNYEVGTYYHFAHNLHLYNRDLGKFKTIKPQGAAQSRADEYR